MAFYKKTKKVDEFDYRDVYVEIYEGLLGPTHCKLPHSPDKRVCDVCNRPIRPIRVHVVVIFGRDLDKLLVNMTALAVRRWAEKMIDETIDNIGDLGGEDTGDPDDDEKEGDDTGNKADDGLPMLPPPPDEPEAPPDKRGRGDKTQSPANRLAKLADRMKKLGWPQRAMGIVREEFRKRGKLPPKKD